jgi:hypothetical protein
LIADIADEAVVLAIIAAHAESVIHTITPIALMTGDADGAVNQRRIKDILLEGLAGVPDLGFAISHLRHHGNIYIGVDCPTLVARLALHRHTDRRFNDVDVIGGRLVDGVDVKVGVTDAKVRCHRQGVRCKGTDWTA